MDEMLNQSEAARRLGVPRRRLVWWLCTGALPSFRPHPSAARLIRADDLIAFKTRTLGKIRRGRPPGRRLVRLKDVAGLCSSVMDARFVPAIKTFYQDFAEHPALSMIRDEPRDHGNELDAYLAAVAETLALQYGWINPPWTMAPSRSLSRPWFDEGMPLFRAMHLRDAPAAWKARNIFVSGDTMTAALLKETGGASEC